MSISDLDQKAVTEFLALCGSSLKATEQHATVSYFAVKVAERLVATKIRVVLRNGPIIGNFSTFTSKSIQVGQYHLSDVGISTTELIADIVTGKQIGRAHV